MAFILIFLFATLFAYTTYRRFAWGVFLLCLLLPTYLIRFNVGPLPTTVLEVMIWIILLLGFFKKGIPPLAATLGRDDIKKNRLLLSGIFLFILGATVSIFTSINTRAALGEWKAFYVEPVLLFIILVIRNPKSYILHLTSYILTPLILCGLATSLLSIYQHFTGFLVPHAFWANQNTYRVTGWYGFPNAVGLFLAPLVPLAVYLVKENFGVVKVRMKELKITEFFNSSILQFFICLLFLPSSLLAILFAKSTGGLIGVLAGIGILLLFYKKTRLSVCLVSLVGIASLVSLSPTNPVKQELLAQDRSGQIRIAIWKETTELLKDHPIAGAGLASYSDKIEPYHKTVNGEGIEIFHHAHNIFLTMWVNLGLTGFLGFMVILIWYYHTGQREIRNLKLETSDTVPISNFQFPISAYLIASMTSLLVTGLVDSPYIKNDLSIFFWLLIALMFITSRTPLDIRN